MNENLAKEGLERARRLARRWKGLDEDDLVQEVMLSCLKYEKREGREFSPTRQHVTWRATDMLRRMRKDEEKKKNLKRRLRGYELNGTGDVDRRDEVEMLMRRLDSTERELIWRKFWQGQTLLELGRHYKISKEGVRLRLNAVLVKLRQGPLSRKD